MSSSYPLRPEWVMAMTRTAQLAADASLEPQQTVWAMLAALVDGIQAPITPFERLFAVHVCERAAWSLLDVQVRRGLRRASVVHRDYRAVVQIMETTNWAELSASLRRQLPAVSSTPRVVAVRDYLDEHALRRLTLHEVARDVGASVRWISQQFPRQFGVSPYEYVTRRRLAQAIVLLTTTDMKMAAVADAVGFKDKTALFRQFSRMLDTTPGSVRAHRVDVPQLLRRLEDDSSAWPARPIPNRNPSCLTRNSSHSFER
jgi:AraC-like DNA-binding protein